jgi:hypothetical protein
VTPSTSTSRPSQPWTSTRRSSDRLWVPTDAGRPGSTADSGRWRPRASSSARSVVTASASTSGWSLSRLPVRAKRRGRLPPWLEESDAVLVHAKYSHSATRDVQTSRDQPRAHARSGTASVATRGDRVGVPLAVDSLRGPACGAAALAAPAAASGPPRLPPADESLLRDARRRVCWKSATRGQRADEDRGSQALPGVDDHNCSG